MKYRVNGVEKELKDMTDAEFDLVKNRSPVGYDGASTCAVQYVSWDVWTEMGRRYDLRRVLGKSADS